MTPATKRLQEELMTVKETEKSKKTPQKPKKPIGRKGPKPLDRQILRQMWQDGKTGREIAVSMGQTLSAVYMAIQREKQRGVEMVNRRPGFTAWQVRQGSPVEPHYDSHGDSRSAAREK